MNSYQMPALVIDIDEASTVKVIQLLSNSLNASMAASGRKDQLFQNLFTAAAEIGNPYQYVSAEYSTLQLPGKEDQVSVSGVSNLINNPFLTSMDNEETFYERKSLSISQYDRLLYIKKDYCGANEKVAFILSGEDVPDIRLLRSQMEAAFLYYLLYERKHGGSNWLRDPLEHEAVINKILSEFILPLEYDDWKEQVANYDRDKKAKTWIDDFGNHYRKSIVSRINGTNWPVNISGQLIVNVRASRFKKGTYTLNKSIKTIIM